MKLLKQSFLVLLMLSLLTGGLYPILVTGLGSLLFADQAQGQIVTRNGEKVASRLMAQKISSDRYFWPRPSATDYNGAASSGSNLGPTSKDLKKLYEERRSLVMAAHPLDGEPPQELLFASGSGLDPEITPAAAFYQLNRVAKGRNLSEAQKLSLKALVEKHIQKPEWGFIGEERVNVIDLNLSLDNL